MYKFICVQNVDCCVTVGIEKNVKSKISVRCENYERVEAQDI